MIVNNDEDPSHFLTYRISSAFQKWTELKHLLTDRRTVMSSRIKILEACVRSATGSYIVLNRGNFLHQK